VDELIDEGIAFEAHVVTSVESGGTGDKKDVHAHELAEDDLPVECLDKN
jgi:hypothetical protein